MKLKHADRKPTRREHRDDRTDKARVASTSSSGWAVRLGETGPPLLSLRQTFDPSNRHLLHALQAKLTINEPGDQYEQEADRVAEQVMRMPDPAIRLQRKCGCGGSTNTGESCEECASRSVQLQRRTTAQNRSSETTAPSVVHDTLRSTGQPLDKSTRAFFEPRFGHDFSHVRIHNDAHAAQSARAVNARAYTVGSDIVFGPGQYSPGTMQGTNLLAHELTHVVQQSGKIVPGGLLGISNATGIPRLSRAYFNVGTVRVNIDYGNLVYIPLSDYLAEIETRFASWTGSPASVIHASLGSLTPRQLEWVLFGLDVLVDNTTAAHSALNRVQAVQRLITRAPSSTTRGLATASFDFENEVLRVSGWYEVALTAGLTAPTGATLTTITGLYNPALAGPLNATCLQNDIPPALTTLLTTLDPANWTATGMRSLSTIQSIADQVQAIARTFFAPYADTAMNNVQAGGWVYSANLVGAAAVAPTRDQRIGYLLNRAEIVGRETRSGGTIFANCNFDSSRTADRLELLNIATNMETNAVIAGRVNRLIQITGRTSRATNTVGISTAFDLGSFTECQDRWRTIDTLTHELVHVLVHPGFPPRASSIRFGQIVAEGFTEALGVQLYEHIRSRANADPTFKAQMEAGLATAPCPIPAAATIGYGAAGPSAETIRTLVGDDNFRAAYFLGAVNLVGL